MILLLMGVLSVALGASDIDSDGFSAVEGDCDDADAAVSPLGTEICDAIDNDCDGSVDEDGCDCRVATYEDHSYLLCDDNLSWNDAQKACDDAGYHLVTVDDASENTALIYATVGLLSGDTWIGLNDQAREGTFVWDDGSAVSYTDWGLLEPDDGLIFGSEDCVAMSVPLVGLVADWYDEDCDSRADYVCESECTTLLAWGDADGDGYGDSGDLYTGCTVPDGYVYDDSDCDDGDASTHPDADELSDGVDNDCDGHDERYDADGDGLSDLDEATYGTDPADADTDDGGVGDGDEVDAGSDPLDASDDDGAPDDSGSDTGSVGTTDTGADTGTDTDTDTDTDTSPDSGPAEDTDTGADTGEDTGEDTSGGDTGGVDPDTLDTWSDGNDTGADGRLEGRGVYRGGGCACSSAPAPSGASFAGLLGLLSLFFARRRE